MKKVLLVVGLIILMFSQSNFANDMSSFPDQFETNGYYDGNPNETIILESGDDYIVVRNTTAKAKIAFKKKDGSVLYYGPAEVFEKVNEENCRKNKKFPQVKNVNTPTFDEHTVLLWCQVSLKDLYVRAHGNVSEDFSTELLMYKFCNNWNEEGDTETFKYYSCKKLIKKMEKKWPQAKQSYKIVEAQEEKYANHQDITFEIKKRVLAKSQKPSISQEDTNTIIAASSGTGFFVSTNGHMVTNNHVIDSCDIVKAHYKGRELDAEVLFNDRTNDLAIIKANIKPNRVFAVSNEDVTLLEDIIVAGYPLGKNISASIKTFKGSVTALAGYGDNFSNFQIDASLSSGNSGGPIINQKGNVVGVAVEKLVEVGVEGFNFGVKSSTLKTFASSNQFKFQDPSTEELSNKELGQLITEATIYLECWMSVAKIKQIIEEGERQKAFFSEYK